MQAYIIILKLIFNNKLLKCFTFQKQIKIYTDNNLSVQIRNYYNKYISNIHIPLIL